MKNDSTRARNGVEEAKATAGRVLEALSACVQQERRHLRSPAARIGIREIYVGVFKTDLSLSGRFRSHGRQIKAAYVRADAGVVGRINPTRPRADVWRRIFGSETVPLRSAKTRVFRYPMDPARSCEMLDVDVEALDDATVFRVANDVAERMGLEPERVVRSMRMLGFPIAAEDVVIIEIEDRPRTRSARTNAPGGAA